MIVADPTIAAIPDVALRQQVLFVEIPLGSIHRGALARSSAPGQCELVVGVNHLADGFVECLLTDVTPVDPGELARIDVIQRSRRLHRSEIAAKAKHRGQIARNGVFELGIVAGERTEAAPVQPVLSIAQDIEQMNWLQVLGDLDFQSA